MAAPKRNKALAAVRAVEARRKPASKRPSRPSGGGSFGGWETVEEFGDWRLPVLRPTRPCPQCGGEATPERGRDNSLGSYWTCTGGHSFAVAPADARLASCVEQVEITTAKGAKRSAPCTAKLQSLGPFLVCPKHQRAVWPLVEDASPITLCEEGERVAARLAAFVVESGDPFELRDGEVPFGYTDEEWAEKLAGLGSDDAATSSTNDLPDVDGLGVEGFGSASYPEAVTPPEDDEPVPASIAPTVAPRAALAAALAPRRPNGAAERVERRSVAAGDERLFSVAEVPVEVKRKRVDALSPSSATKLKECPRRFEFNKVLGRPEPTGKAAAGGVFGHKILELLTEHPLPARTEDAARALAARLWADISKPPGSPVEFVEADAKEVEELRRDLVQLGTLTDREAVRAFKAGVWAGVKYAVSIEPSYGGEVAYRELWIEGIEVAGVPVRMKVDRIDRHRDRRQEWLTIVDYKFGKYPQARDGSLDAAKLADTGDQLLLYWPAVEMVTGEKVKGALLAYVGEGAQMTLWVDPARLEAAQRMLASLWKQLGVYELAARTNGTPYPAETGYLCGWCPFFEDCQPGSAWLLSEFAAEWMRKREARGEPSPPAMVEVQSWTRDRRQAWWEMARRA